MELSDAASFFDTVAFDAYDFTSGFWNSNQFVGQLQEADSFVTLWNRPTRKRMLHTAPQEVIPSSVVRVSATGEIYMVGTAQSDILHDENYRRINGLHQPQGAAVHRRLTPVEVLGVSQWASNETIRNTFADVELRSVDENQNAKIDNYGQFLLFCPGDEALQRQDTVEVGGSVYFVIEPYLDGGLACARVSLHPDERMNFVYKSFVSTAYDPNTQLNTPTFTSYNTTGKITSASAKVTMGSDVGETLDIMLHDRFISFEPKLEDEITFNGSTFRVSEKRRNSILSEWYLTAQLAG
jgi:hypothetical protein